MTARLFILTVLCAVVSALAAVGAGAVIRVPIPAPAVPPIPASTSHARPVPDPSVPCRPDFCWQPPPPEAQFCWIEPWFCDSPEGRYGGALTSRTATSGAAVRRSSTNQLEEGVLA